MSGYRINFQIGGTAAAPAPAPPAIDEAAALIEFLCDPELAGTIPVPERAIRFAPEWFKRLKPDMGMTYENGLPAMTAKACLPMTDAFSLGFILPLPYDVLIRVPEDRVSIELGWAEGVAFRPVEQHHPAQIGAPEPPFERTMPLKFINPWRIKVPEGYSVLFVQPLSRPDLPFTCFSGFVDCDRFDTTVNLPFAWTGPAGEHLLPAGTPIAQMIPIRRDTLIKQERARGSTAEELAGQAAAAARKYGEESTYRREWRVKK